MRIQSIRLAIAASLLLACTAATAAQNVTIVGTMEGKTANTLQVRTDEGLQTFSTDGMNLDATLAAGDFVRVTYSDVNGKLTAQSVGRVASVTVTLPGEAGVERLVVEEVETGSLSSIAGMGAVKAKVMMAGNNRVTIRTADDGVPVVALRTHLPKGTTNFQNGDNILLNVPEAILRDELYVSTTPVEPEPVARLQYEAVPEPKNEPVREIAQVPANQNLQSTATPRPAEPTRTTGSSSSTSTVRDENRLPQTASALHATGLIGLAALVLGLGIGVARRLW